MKIYTKTGDQGQTGLGTGDRVWKDDLLLEAYGTVDELNSVLGLVRSEKISRELQESLHRIQGELFQIGADLAYPESRNKGKSLPITRVSATLSAPLEKEIDVAEETLPPLRQFILPGGSKSASLLHLARTICRRAERGAAGLFKEGHCNPAIVVYLNRLADWLFVMARRVNQLEGVEDIPWSPPKQEG